MKKVLNLPIMALSLSVLFFAGSGVYTRLSDASIIFNVTVRSLLAIIIYMGLVEASKRGKSKNKGWSHIGLKDILLLIVMGFLSALDLLFYFTAIEYTNLSYAILITVSTPLVILPLSVVFYREFPPILFYLGLIIALLGGYMVLGFTASETAIDGDDIKGFFYASISTIAFGVYMFILSHRKSKLDTFETMLFISIGSAILFCVFALVKGESILPPNAIAWLIVILFCLNSQVIGQGLMIFSLNKMPVNLSSAIFLTTPLVASIYGWIFFDETITLFQVFGMVICLIGIFLIKIAYDQLERKHQKKALREATIHASSHLE